MNKLIATMLAILILSSTAQADDLCVTGNAFLRIGMGARAAGMGGAFCAIVDDASSNYWNPAGLCEIERQELLFMHTRWLSDISSEYLAYARPMDEDSSLGASLIFLHAEDMARNCQAQETGRFNNHDACLSFSYASRRGNFAWGLTPKVIQRQLKDKTASSIGLDIGSKYVIDNLSLGAAIQNLGTKIKLGSEASPSPLAFKLGIGYKMAEENDSLTIAGDINKLVDSDPSLNLGAEYNYANWAMARIGARIGNSKQGLSSGFGVVFQNWRFDYAFTSFDDLGLTHRAAITRWFGESEGKPAVTVVSAKPETTTTPPMPVTKIAVKDTQLPVPEILETYAFIFPDTRIFSPNGDGTLDSVTFILRTLIQTQINRWELRIVAGDGGVVQVFVGDGLPSQTIVWDGKDKAGNIAPSGTYSCILSVMDKNNKIWIGNKEIVVVE